VAGAELRGHVRGPQVDAALTRGADRCVARQQATRGRILDRAVRFEEAIVAFQDGRSHSGLQWLQRGVDLGSNALESLTIGRRVWQLDAVALALAVDAAIEELAAAGFAYGCHGCLTDPST